MKAILPMVGQRRYLLKSSKKTFVHFIEPETDLGGRVGRWCWVSFQCRGVLLVWIIVGQGPTVLAVGAGGGWMGVFSLVYHFSFLSPSLWETARYRLKYCLKGSLAKNNQPTNKK